MRRPREAAGSGVQQHHGALPVPIAGAHGDVADVPRIHQVDGRNVRVTTQSNQFPGSAPADRVVGTGAGRLELLTSVRLVQAASPLVR
jgi:hypothetical protein